MKKNSYLLISALFILGASNAHAAWSGNWQGVFNTVDNKGDTTGTTGFTFGLTSTSTTITFAEASGLTILNGMALSYSGTTLSLYGHAVGTYSDSNLNFTILDDADAYYIQVGITLNADGSLALTYNILDYVGDYVNGSSSLAVASQTSAGPKAEKTVLDLFTALRNK